MIGTYSPQWPFTRTGWLPRTAKVDYAFELMGAGQFAIDIPRDDFNASLVYPGVMLGIKSRYALPDFAGYVERIEKSEDDEHLTITGKEWVGLLEERTTDQSRTFATGNAGNVSGDIIRQAQGRNPTGLTVTSAVGTPLPAPFTVNSDSVLGALNDLADLTGDEWVVTYSVGPAVTGVLRWVRSVGTDKRDSVHLGGRMIAQADYVSDLVSSSALVRVVGDTGAFKDRPSATVVANGPLALQDTVLYRSALPAGSTPIAYRGVTTARESVVVDANLPDSLSIQHRAIEELRAFMNGAETLSVVVSTAQLWDRYFIGDVVTVRLGALGIVRAFRIYGMQPREDIGKMELVGKVLLDAA